MGVLHYTCFDSDTLLCRAKTIITEEELQILERKARSLSENASTADPSEPFVATELIFKCAFLFLPSTLAHKSFSTTDCMLPSLDKRVTMHGY